MQGVPSTHPASAEIERLVHTVRKHLDDLILVLVGFDGVLAEYHEDPETVGLSPDRRELLRHLIRHPGVALGIVSGRREHRRVFAVHVGEDVAEDDAYEAIAGHHGVAAAVGRRAAQVDHHLESIEMVDQLLVQLSAVRDPGEAHQRS